VGSTMSSLRARTAQAISLESASLHLWISMRDLMKFLRLHDLNNPTQEVLIDTSAGFTVRPAPGGTGSMILCVAGVIFVHEDRNEIETLIEEEQ